MVGAQHEAMHRIFENQPGVFTQTIQILDLPFGEPTVVELLPTDVTEIEPLERRIDTLLRITTREETFLLVVEAQRSKDRGKLASWPYYLTYLHNRYQQVPHLLVICQDETIARWADNPITAATHGRTSFAAFPLVLGPHNVPIVTDPAEAAVNVPLAALSAITHVNDPDIGAILKALAAALQSIDDNDAEVFALLTEAGLGTTPAGDTWRHLMTLSSSMIRTVTTERLRDQGRAEEAAGSVIRVLERRGLPVTDSTRARIRSCTDLETLHHWLDLATTAATAEEIFT
ncbi:hypothetical protein [Nocardia cyriacigeorgica]|uniref:hypothetical protein n=1 Tax=Nocardia cyriacigeorgica TaxID=135487 RepID=UPI0013D5CE85|nr:hypothetical protein [Nocardia cyriacigeorgica]MBF6440343.1 hypothetical protein [Nocardia cyriacigeorgica]NEW26999.1 hypothetical protein [Nocardia cyriacigeorgica]